MYSEEKCEACNYKGSIRTFSQISIGYNLGDYHHESECDIATGGLRDRINLIGCPECGTIKIAGINKCSEEDFNERV